MYFALKAGRHLSNILPDMSYKRVDSYKKLEMLQISCTLSIIYHPNVCDYNRAAFKGAISHFHLVSPSPLKIVRRNCYFFF